MQLPLFVPRGWTVENWLIVQQALEVLKLSASPAAPPPQPVSVEGR